MRPGNLSDYESMTPRMLGSFSGKGDVSPPPGPPPAGSVSGGKVISTAKNKTTGKFYVQDPKCSTIGMKMTKWSEACKGADCDPGETDSGEDCDDDPDFLELMDPPDGGFRSCEEWTIFDYPSSECTKETCPSCFKQATSQPRQPKAPKKSVKKAKPKLNRPPLSIPFKGSCPKTHFKSKDAGGDYCKPCAPGQLFHAGKCKPRPPACPCKLKRQGDPDFGKCPTPPRGCGPAPKHQRCSVPGQGVMNPVCKCGKWQCPTNKDILIAKFKRQGKPIPKGLADYGTAPAGYKKPMIGLALLGAAVAAYFLLSK
jgi:hypothetical protein